jgi:hypothetical protein
MAKRAKESPPESQIVKVVDPLYDAPAEVDALPESPREPSRPALGRRLTRFFEFLLRVISWVIILGVIGGGLYFGLPLLYQRFVAPVEQNTAQMGELQSQQKLTEEELAALQDKLKTLETVQSQNAQSLSELDKSLSQLKTEIDAHTQSLAVLERMQTQLQAQNEATSAELDRQIDLLKVMELLSRARLFMYQSNFGLARQDVQDARDLLANVQPSSKSLANDLDAVIRRLDLALSNLPNFPVAASDDLNIAWQILLSGLPAASTPMSETAVPVITPSPTPQPAATPTATP